MYAEGLLVALYYTIWQQEHLLHSNRELTQPGHEAGEDEDWQAAVVVGGAVEQITDNAGKSGKQHGGLEALVGPEAEHCREVQWCLSRTVNWCDLEGRVPEVCVSLFCSSGSQDRALLQASEICFSCSLMC